MKTRAVLLGCCAILALAGCRSDESTAAPADELPSLTFGRFPAPRRAPRFVAAASNAVAGNAVLFFARKADGSLAAPVSFPTGGTGSGGGLGNQAGIALDAYAMHLYVVNAGSNSISVFNVENDGLVLAQTIASGGTQPISLAVSDELLYVLNDGGVANISGFRIRRNGRLDPIANSTRPLTVPAPDAAQIGFSRNDRRLIVTEKATNNIVTFRLDRDDRPETPIVTVSNGATPFGFHVAEDRGELIVSEAFGGATDASAVSSYRLRRGVPQTLTASAPTTESAACWIAISGDGKFAYTSNTASNTISGFALARNGSLSLLDADGVTATTGGGPIDLATREGLDFLYSLDRVSGQVSFYYIKGDGALEPLGVAGGLPTSANGLVVF
jgi:6-phosphogluconolactonase